MTSGIRKLRRFWAECPEQIRTLLLVLALTVIYYATGRVGLSLALPPGLATPVWFPSGIALSALLLLGRRVWPGIWLGSFAVNLETLFDAGPRFVSALAVVGAVATGSTLQTLVMARLVERYAGGARPFDRVRHVVLFVGFTVPSCAIAASVGAASLVLGRFAAPADFGLTWLTWWVGDVTGILVVAPLALTWQLMPQVRWNKLRWLEAACFVVLLLITGEFVFGDWRISGDARHPLPFPFLPFLVWGAIRFGQQGIVITAISISAMAIEGTLRGWGPFAVSERHAGLLMLQMFIGVIVVTGLVLAAAFGERRRAEAALRESEERERLRAAELETVLAATPAIVWIAHDPQCRHITGNRAADELLRLRIGSEASLTAPADRRPTHFRAFQNGRELGPYELPVQQAARGIEVRDFEVSIVFDDGMTRNLLGNATPLYDERGVPRGAIAAFVDITERKQVEEELRALNTGLEQRVFRRTAELEKRTRQLRRLAIEMSAAEQRERRRIAVTLHDHLQQILVAAKYGVDQLRSGIDEEARSLEPMIVRVGSLISESINASRTLAVELNPPVLYDRGLGAALGWLQRQFREKHGLETTIAIGEGAEPVDPGVQAFLFQSVRELLLNVVKHAGTSRADISMTRNADNMVQITVTDAGVGCDPKHLVQNSDANGSFGLFNIQQRIDLLGGRFLIESAPGHGCRLTLCAPISSSPGLDETPRRPASASHAVAAVPAPDGSARRSIRVLIADDHRIVREGLAGILQLQPGIEVVGQAENGRTALELARQLRPDVVAMDVSMPVMDGIDATRSIKRELPDVRVIGLSMHEEEDMSAAMRDAGASAYLTKGGPSDALIAAIRG